MAQLETAPFYKKASPEKQQKIRGIIYDKVLTPLAKQHGLGQLPDRQAWITKNEAGVTSSLTPTSAKLAFSTAHSALGMVEAAQGATSFVTGINKSYLGGKQVAGEKASLQQWMDFHFSKSLKDRALKEVGSITGQLPAFELAGGLVGEIPFWNEEALSSMGRMGQYAMHSLKGAAEGVLVGFGTHDSIASNAVGFGLFGFVGRLLGLTGGKGVQKIASMASEAVENEAKEVTAHPLVVATAGKLKDKLTASMVQELNKVVEGGDFLKASGQAKKTALEKLGKLTGEISDNLAAFNPDLVEADAAASLRKQRLENPDLNDILTKLEKASGEPTEKTIADYAQKKAERKVKIGKRGSEAEKQARLEFLKTARAAKAAKRGSAGITSSSVGAASAGSLEFEDNVSKLLPSNIKFEDRGHKFLAALNVLLHAQKTGEHMTQADDELFRGLMQHLQEKYPGKTLKDMMEAGDNVWKKLGEIVKASNDPSVRKWGLRFFRQSSVFPDEVQSPWKHEVDLFTKSGRYAEEQGLQVGSRYRIGATKHTAELVEVGPKTSKVRLPGDKIAHVSNEQLVDPSKNIVQAKEEILKRRAARAK